MAYSQSFYIIEGKKAVPVDLTKIQDKTELKKAVLTDYKDFPVEYLRVIECPCIINAGGPTWPTSEFSSKDLVENLTKYKNSKYDDNIIFVVGNIGRVVSRQNCYVIPVVPCVIEERDFSNRVNMQIEPLIFKYDESDLLKSYRFDRVVSHNIHKEKLISIPLDDLVLIESPVFFEESGYVKDAEKNISVKKSYEENVIEQFLRYGKAGFVRVIGKDRTCDSYRTGFPYITLEYLPKSN